MTPFRIIFVLLSCAAIMGAAYVANQGYGGASTDLDASVRTGSGGGYNGGRIK